MQSYGPEQLISKHQEQQESRGELAEQALEWFLEDDIIGQLYPRPEVVGELADHMGVASDRANMALSDTVGDIVDPVQQIVTAEEKYVGVINYKVYSDEGAYGYVDFDDRKGKRKRVVCARCVEKEETDTNITHATQGEGTANDDATWKQLRNKITSHYASSHSKAPDDIRAGAILLSGTTIAGNTAFHIGNDGEGSGLSADTVRGEVFSQIEQSLKFGAEGSSTTSTSYTTIPDSDIAVDFSNYRDPDGNLKIRLVAHIDVDVEGETVSARVFRQNAGTVLSGTEVSYTNNNIGQFGIVTSGWTDISSESGQESYQIQLKVSDGEGYYNSMVLQVRT